MLVKAVAAVAPDAHLPLLQSKMPLMHDAGSYSCSDHDIKLAPGTTTLRQHEIFVRTKRLRELALPSNMVNMEQPTSGMVMAFMLGQLADEKCAATS